MLELFEYTFMQRALFEALLVGAVCSIVGVYVVLNRLSFIGAGISHATFGGVAIGLLTGIEPALTAFLFSALTATGVGFVGEKGTLSQDTAIGIFFAATMALGVLLVSLLEGMYVDVFGYLFGNILSVTDTDLLLGLVTGVVILLVIILFAKELLALSFDREMAEVMGLPVRALNYLLLFLISLTVVVSVKSVGAVLVAALLVTPAASAQLLAKSFRSMVFYSLAFGTGASVAGLLLSAWLDIPSGATIVLTATAVFFVVWLLSAGRRKD